MGGKKIRVVDRDHDPFVFRSTTYDGFPFEQGIGFYDPITIAEKHRQNVRRHLVERGLVRLTIPGEPSWATPFRRALNRSKEQQRAVDAANRIRRKG